MRGEDPEGCSRDKGIRTIDLCFRKATLTETCRFSLWHQCGWLSPRGTRKMLRASCVTTLQVFGLRNLGLRVTNFVTRRRN